LKLYDVPTQILAVVVEVERALTVSVIGLLTTERDVTQALLLVRVQETALPFVNALEV